MDLATLKPISIELGEPMLRVHDCGVKRGDKVPVAFDETLDP
jgi:hypothetical protein